MKKIIHAYTVKQAAKTDRVISIDDRTVITPLARETARELNVRFVKGPLPKKSNRLKDVTDVKVIVIGADHGGFKMKEELKSFLREHQFIVHDLGTGSEKACDYPDYAFAVAEAVSRGEADLGIMIDSVGIGSAMAANRVPGVLAAKCNTVVEARSAREHNYANVLTLGAKMIGMTMAQEIALAFIQTAGGAERHKRRVTKILEYDPVKNQNL